MNSETKLFLAIIAATVAIVAIGFVLMSRPAPTFSREQMLPASTQTKGNVFSTAYLVEFSDFQCPACKAAKPVVDQLIAEYKDQLVFGYRHLPLPQHQFAHPAAIAAEAAALQGKFWEAYDLLFQNQDVLSEDFFVTKLPQVLSLDMSQYEKDRKSSSVSAKIDKDKQDAAVFGINATPMFFLNGIKLTLSSFDQLREEVKKALQ